MKIFLAFCLALTAVVCKLEQTEGAALPTQKSKVCFQPLDVGILVDVQSSHHVGPFFSEEKPFDKTKEHVEEILGELLDISASDVRVAIGTISQKPRVVLGLSEYKGKEKAIDALEKIKSEKGRGDLMGALQMVVDKKMMADTRAGAKKILVVVTDAICRGFCVGIDGKEGQIAAHGITTMTLGVGSDIDVMNLIIMASSDEYVYSSRSVKPFVRKINNMRVRKC